ncbi:MAG: DoxX family protein [Chlamydiae bacterium]|nr:DoxX family protein [Chlamydiota bacterium]MBI3278174.1 DoxX family protein [Chlamydiota bacterium]
MAKSVAEGASNTKSGSGKTTWLALLRIYMGAYFIHTSIDKFTASYLGEFSRLVSRWAHHTNFAWYEGFLNNYVLPHAKFFAYLTAIGEFYVGLSLILGFLSGLAAIFGILLYINYYLGEGSPEEVWRFGMILVNLFVIVVTGAGRVFGLDKFLSKKILFKYIV